MTLCHAPTSSLYRDPLGYFAPCCIFKPTTHEFDLPTYFKSQELTGVIETLAAGAYPPQCNICARDAELDRPIYATSFEFDTIKIDIRDRTCNLECLTCGPHASTAHGAAVKKVFPNNNFNLQQVYDFIAANLNKIKVAYFAGGEPFMSQITFKILDMLEPDTQLHFSSNLSITKYKGVSVREYLAKFTGGVVIMRSCDGIV